MDIQMPIMDGLEATRIIRQTEGFPRLPIIGVTANGDLESRSGAKEAGMDGFVTKPMKIMDLKLAVGRVMKHQEF